MKTLYTALLLIALSAAAAEPVDPESRTDKDTAPIASTGDYGKGSAGRQRSGAPAPQSDDATDDQGASSSSGLNYETGQLCLTRGAGGICLESSDD